MSPGRHAVASAGLAAGVGALGGDFVAIAATFIAGTAIDADHVLDFFLNRSGRFTISAFLSVCNQYRLTRFFLFFHSLEVIIPFVFAVFILGSPLWLKGVAAGLAVHMLMDLAGNGLYPKAYFFLWRLAVGFNFRRAVAWLPESGLEYWGSYQAFMKGRPESCRGRQRPAGRKPRGTPA